MITEWQQPPLCLQLQPLLLQIALHSLSLGFEETQAISFFSILFYHILTAYHFNFASALSCCWSSDIYTSPPMCIPAGKVVNNGLLLQ